MINGTNLHDSLTQLVNQSSLNNYLSSQLTSINANLIYNPFKTYGIIDTDLNIHYRLFKTCNFLKIERI